MQNVIVLADLLSLVLFSDGDAVTPEGEVTFLARERVQRNIFLLPNSVFFLFCSRFFSQLTGSAQIYGEGPIHFPHRCTVVGARVETKMPFYVFVKSSKFFQSIHFCHKLTVLTPLFLRKSQDFSIFAKIHV